jgi:hypothetical protein
MIEPVDDMIFDVWILEATRAIGNIGNIWERIMTPTKLTLNSWSDGSFFRVLSSLEIFRGYLGE